MNQSFNFGIIAGALLVAGLFVTTTPVQATVVAGSNGVVLAVYANPFDPNNDGVGSGTEATIMTNGAIGAGTVGIPSGWSQANLVNRRDRYDDSYGTRLQDDTGVATNAFAQFQAASSFNAGTVIASQFTFAPFNNATPYTLKLDGTTVQTGPGIAGTVPIKVTTLPTLLTNVSTLRLEEGMSPYSGSTQHYALMNEVMILPRRLELVPATVTLTAGTVWFGAPQAVSDLDGYGWGAFNNPSLKLDFGAPKIVTTLVLANFENGAVSFNIRNDVGTVIGHVELTGNNTYGDFLPIDLITPVTTSFLTFDFTDLSLAGQTANSSAMREIMVFTVPEPSTVMLFGLGGLLVARKMRKTLTNQTGSQQRRKTNMHKSIKFGIIAGALLVAGLFITMTPVRATTVTGNLSIEANPFDVNNDGVISPTEATMTNGAVGAGTVGVAGGWVQDSLVNRHDGHQDGGGEAVRLQDTTGVATNSFMQFVAASSFSVGTVISAQYVLPAPFNNATPFTLKLDGTTIQTGPGTLGTHPIQVTTMQSVTNASTLRIEEGMSAYNNSTTHYAEFNEVLILPKRLELVPATVTQTAGTSWFNTPQAVSDLDGYGWGGFSNPSLKLNFGAPKIVSTLVIANFDASGGPVNFNIRDDTGGLIGNVQMAGGAYGEFTPIDLITPVTTSFLTLDFTDVTGGRSALREIMVFTVPEPSSVLLFGLSGLLLSRKIRKH